MKLSVFRDSYEIETVADLRPHLSFRHDEHYASFWLSTDSETDPSLGIFINRDRAVAFYFRESGDPGYYSNGPDTGDAVSYTHLPSPRDKRQSRMPSSA